MTFFLFDCLSILHVTDCYESKGYTFTIPHKLNISRFIHHLWVKYTFLFSVKMYALFLYALPFRVWVCKFNLCGSNGSHTFFSVCDFCYTHFLYFRRKYYGKHHFKKEVYVFKRHL